MESDNHTLAIRPYQAIIWGPEPGSVGTRAIYYAADGDGARMQAILEHGEHCIISIWNEEDSERPRSIMNSQIPAELNQIIDEHLSRGEVLAAIRILTDDGRCSIADGKEAVGRRFRERFPQLFETYRNLEDEE